MSKHPTDRLALLVGIPLLLLGLADLADTAGVFHAGSWLVVPGLVVAGLIGITWSLRSLRPATVPPPFSAPVGDGLDEPVTGAVTEEDAGRSTT